MIELLGATPDEPRRRAVDHERIARRDLARRLVGDGSVDEHPIRGDQRLCLGAARGRAPAGRVRRRAVGEPPPTISWRIAAGAAAPPSWPAPSSPAPSSWRGPSWPAPSSSPGPSSRAPSSSRGPSSPAPSSWRAPSWPAPSWRRPAALDLGLDGSAIFSASSSKRSSSSSKRSESHHLLGDLRCTSSLTRSEVSRPRSSSVCTAFSASCDDLAGLDERLDDRLGLLAGHVGELDTGIDEPLNCRFCHAADYCAVPGSVMRRDDVAHLSEIGDVEIDP